MSIEDPRKIQKNNKKKNKNHFSTTDRSYILDFPVLDIVFLWLP